MKKRALNSVASVFILLCVAVAGTMVTVRNFMQIYATAGLALWTAAAAAVCGAVVCIGIRLMGRLGIICRILIFAGLIALVWLRFDMLAGGMAYIVNFLIEDINDYYSGGLYYIYLTEEMLEKANQPLFMLIICALSGWGYMSALLNRKGTFFVELVSIMSYMLPATLENAPPSYILIGMMCFVLCCVVQGKLPRERDELRGRMSGILAMTWVILLGLVLLFAATRLVPRDEYLAPGFYKNMVGKIVFSLKDVQLAVEGNSVSPEGSTGAVGTGSIGRVDELEYKDIPIFSIRAPKKGGTLYLKAFQAANYTKRRWKELDASVYRRNEALFDELYASEQVPQLMEYYAVSRLTGMGAVGIADVTYDIELMQYVGDGNSYVPMSAIQVDGVTVDELAEYDRNIALEGDVWGANGVKHSCRLSEWRNFSSLEKLVIDGMVLSGESGDNPYRDFVYEYYLDDNTSCADRIREELFPAITGNAYEPWDMSQRARFIMETINFLAEEYEYTLSPGATPGDEDYVEYFLFDEKKGICTHFASAAVMIFRCAGMPARYVEGYVVPESLYGTEPVALKPVSVSENGEFSEEKWEYYDAVVTDRYAHAWVEVYLDGIGWTTIDPTPGYSSQYSDSQTWLFDEEGSDGNEDTLSEEGITAGEGTEESLGASESPAASEGEAGGEPYEETADTDDGQNNGVHEDEKDGTGGGTDIVVTDDRDGAEGDGLSGQDKDGFDDEEENTVSVPELLSGLLRRAAHIFSVILKITALPAAIVLFLVIRQKYMEHGRGKLYNKGCGLKADERIRRIMLYYEKLLKHTGIRMPDSMSITELIETSAMTDRYKRQASAAVDKALYSASSVDENEVMQVMAFVAAEREAVYAGRGVSGRLFLKYILAL